MGFRGGNRGGNRGGSRGGNRGGGGGGGFGGGGRGNSFRGRQGGSQRNFDMGPPENVIPFGSFSYPCEGDLVCKSNIEDVPYFSAPVYLDNKVQIGKIDEIFGTLRDYSVTVKLSENMKASSFKSNQLLYLNPQKLLPLSRFLPKSKGSSNAKRGRGDARGGSRGGRGSVGKSFGNKNGMSRGGNFNKFGSRGGGRGGFGGRGNSSRGRW